MSSRIRTVLIISLICSVPIISLVLIKTANEVDKLAKRATVASMIPVTSIAISNDTFLSYGDTLTVVWRVKSEKAEIDTVYDGWWFPKENGSMLRMPDQEESLIYRTGGLKYPLAVNQEKSIRKFFNSESFKWIKPSDLGLPDTNVAVIFQKDMTVYGVQDDGTLIKHVNGVTSIKRLPGPLFRGPYGIAVSETSNTFALVRDDTLSVYDYQGNLMKSRKLAAPAKEVFYIAAEDKFYASGLIVTSSDGKTYEFTNYVGFADIYSTELISPDGNLLVEFGPFGQSSVGKLIPAER